MNKSLKHISLSANKINKRLDDHPAITTLFVILICAVIIILRKPGIFSLPQFWAEDGVVWFSQAYNLGFWHTIFLPYSGTFSLATRLIGSFAVLFPIKYAPLIFNIAAFSAQLLPVFLINSSRLKKIVRYRLVAILASLILVCIPNSSEVFVNLTNIQWHLGITAILILIAGPPRNIYWKIFDIAALLLVGLTGPLSLVLLPVALLVWLRERKSNNLTNLIVVVTTSLLQLVSLFVIEPGQRGGASPSFIDSIEMWVGQVFTSGILGDQHLYTFYRGPLPYLIFALGLFIIIYAIRCGPRYMGYIWLYAITLYALMLVSLKAVKGSDVWAVLIQQGAGQRYWFILIFIWLMTLLWVTLAARDLIMRTICGIFLLLLIFVGIPSSWKIPSQPNKNYTYYAQQFNSLHKGQVLKIPINPSGWTVILKKH
ncbi:MAG TPA: hypothetical protein VL989_03590 [Candidatus Sulfotelmatobacter sp.]|nr:hypothetical protein [Candidatus Sulfotelmatobacter sp.]